MRFPLYLVLLTTSFLLLNTGISQAVSQQTAPLRTLENNAPPTGITRAVVIGISDYSAQGIQSLNFAHRDAQAFADYLRSRAGGSLPEAQMKVLLNEQATLAAIDDAFFWLKSNSEKGDQAIVYFAGHGDVEAEAHWQFGYLLARDSPPNNFRNNAVRVEDLDLLAIELSSVKEVKTLFIIDACHSGTLSEGRQVPHTHLGKQQANEVRILSCKADQLSLESPQWGGGRGLFSWHLIKGLQGMAKDQSLGGDAEMLTLEELQEYLKKNMRQDAQQLIPAKRQDPVIVGPETFVLANLDADILASVQAESLTESTGNVTIASRSLEASPAAPSSGAPEEDMVEKWIVWLKDYQILQQLDILSLVGIQPEELPASFLKTVQASLGYLPDILLFQSADANTKNRFNQRLAILLHDYGQELMNKYLQADREDLAERSYYRLEKTRYHQHPAMFQLAIQLLPEDHPLVPRLRIKAKYYEGVVKRIQAISLEKPTDTYKEALHIELEALAMDEKAPYIHNELGILYKRLGQDKKSEEHFLIATRLAPSWGLPYNNLCGLALNQKRYAEARMFADNAMRLIPDYYGVHINMGLIYETEGDLFLAEHHYRKAAELDPEHFAPNQLLGQLFIKTTEYNEAESQFIEVIKKLPNMSAVSMENILLENNPWISDNVMGGIAIAAPLDHNDQLMVMKQRIKKNPDDVIAHYQLGYLHMNMGQYEAAEPFFRKVIELDTDYPKIWDYMSFLYYKLGRYAEADVAMNIVRSRYPHHPAQELLHARIYEEWGRYDDAIAIYTSMKEKDAHSVVVLSRLGLLYQHTLRSTEAESTFRQLNSIDKNLSENLLFQLYRRELAQQPNDRYWTYALSSLLVPYCKSAELTTSKQRADRFVFKEAKNSTFSDGVSIYDEFLNPPYIQHDLDQLKWPEVCDLPYEYIESLLESEKNPARISDLLRMRSAIRSKRSEESGAIADLEAYLHTAVDSFSLRDQLIDYYLSQNNLEKYKQHLAFQFNKGKLKYPRHLPLARACTHSGTFDLAAQVLIQFQQVDLEKTYQLNAQDMQARMNWLGGKIKEATKAYTTLAKEQKSAGASYTLARIYASQGKNKDAMKHLATALNQGFDKREVLKNDPTWAKTRDSLEWKNLMAKTFEE
jgi:tetratricopeptide (TPR) repeat protein